MKTTKILTICAAAIALAACSRDGNSPENKSYPVAANFSASINNTRTTPDGSNAKATDWATTDHIGITATSNGLTKYTNEDYVAHSAGLSSTFDFSAGNKIYFQDNQPVTFKAYYPFAGTAGSVPGKDNTNANTGTFIFNTLDQTAESSLSLIDYLWADTTSDINRTGNNTIASNTDNTVVFKFRHAMCELTLDFVPDGTFLQSFTNNSTSSYNTTLDYSLTDVINNGSFDTSTGTATAATTSPDATKGLTMSGIATSDGSKGLTSTVILYPNSQNTGTGPTYTLGLTVTVRGVTYTGTLNTTTDGTTPGNLTGGKHYTYKITVSPTGLIVDGSTITDWSPLTGTDATAS